MASINKVQVLISSTHVHLGIEIIKVLKNINRLTVQAVGGAVAASFTQGGSPSHQGQSHSPIHSVHPALRQLPPSPTPHLDELVEEDRNSNKKRMTPIGGVASCAPTVALAGAQQPRRRSQSKEGVSKTTGRRTRPEEDYDTFLESTMTQLRAMPALTVMEPMVHRNFNVCPIYGSGELGKLGRPDHDHRRGKLEGGSGNLKLKGWFDYYDTKPLGNSLPVLLPLKTPPTSRSFYSMELPPPKIGFPIDETCDEVTALTNTIGANSGGASTPTRPGSATPQSLAADSPDTVLSSSSPECLMPDSPPRFRGLRLIDMEEEIPMDRGPSPSIPLLAPIPIKKGELPAFSSGQFHEILPTKRSVSPKVEHTKKPLSPKVEVSVKEENDPPKLAVPSVKQEPNKDSADTFSFTENYGSIILKNRVGENPALPLKHEGNVEVELTLNSNACEEIAQCLRSLATLLNIPPPQVYDIKHQGDLPKMPKSWKVSGKNGQSTEVNVEKILNGQTRFCRHCGDIANKNPITRRSCDMPYVNRELLIGVDEVTFCGEQCCLQYSLQHRVDVPSLPSLLPQGTESNSQNDSDSDSESDSSQTTRGRKRKLDDCEDDDKTDEEEYPVQADGKRYRGYKYRIFNGDTMLPEKKEKPTEREMTELLFRMQITYRKRGLPQDSRRCILCQLYGDCVADGPSRLLNHDLDKWVHLNCALWGDDVYETMSGSLVNVDTAVKKCLSFVCEHCETPGASVKCFKVRCSKVFHLNCAVKEGCTFYKNKTVYCQEHSTKGEKESELSTLAAWRRVYVERDESRQVASVMHHTELNHLLRIGSLVLINIGQLLPTQLQAFHTPYCIYPVGFKVIRFYWSMRHLHKRCAYQCSILEVEGQPEFEIVVMEDGYDDVSLVSRSPKGVWNKVLTPITEMRQAADLVKLFPQYISGEDLFGLTEPAIVRILESLPGIDTLADYNFKFGRNPLFELPLAVNPTGCARSEPFNKTQLKRYHGLRTSAGSIR